eukprot:m.109729 g.109729  ORF g.109729 m.109729 type:complete len:453 (+) comp51780_c0_seq2:2794-4152(+)
MSQRENRLYDLFTQIEAEFQTLRVQNEFLMRRVEELETLLEDTLEKQQERAVTQDPTPPHQTAQSLAIPSQKTSTASKMTKKLEAAKASTNKIMSKFRIEGSMPFEICYEKSFRAHSDGIWEIACSPFEAGTFGTASADQTARIWSVDSNVPLAMYAGHTGSVNSIAFHATQFLACTASGDSTAHVWKIPHRSASQSARRSFSKDDHDGAEEFKKEDSCVNIREASVLLKGHQGPVTSVDWLSKHDQIVSGSWDNTIRLWDVETGSMILTLQGHEKHVTHVHAHPSNRLIVSASRDCTFRLWDFRQAAIHEVNICQVHTAPITSALLTASNNIVSGSDDRTIKIWDLRQLRTALTTIRLDTGVNRLSISPTSIIAAPLDDRVLKLYDLQGNKLARTPRARCHKSIVTCAAWASDESLWSCDFSAHVGGWKVNALKRIGRRHLESVSESQKPR